MSDTKALFETLRASADPQVAAAIETLVGEGTDRALCRVNALVFAAERSLDEEKVIGAFLHAARLGLFELSWNVLCPGCGGVLDTTQTLKSVRKDSYDCALCACGYEPTLDEMVEVTFTVSPRVRHIAAHDPHLLPIVEYFRQIFWGSGVDLPETGLDELIEEITLDAIELAPGEKASMSLQLPAEFIIVFEPVTHAAHFIDVKGEPTRERQSLAMIFNKMHAPTGTTELRPGPLRLSFDNRTDVRTLPSVWIAGEKLHHLLGKRRAFLTAKRLLTNQTFRDIYRTDTLGRRPGPEDHQPDVPVHRPQRLDRAVRPGRRRGRLRLGAPALPRAAGDRGVGGRRSGQDDRRCGDGDVPDTRPGARRGAAHARTRCAPSRTIS